MQHSKVLYDKGILHNKTMITQSQLSQIQFKGSISLVKNLIDALKALNIEKVTEAFVHIGENGLEVVVEDSNCFQAILYVTDVAFSEYELHGLARFKINLSMLCECLSVFQISETSMRLIYKGRGAPLVMLMEDSANSNCIIECSIKTQNEAEPLHFEEEASLNQIVLRSGQLLEILNEVDKACEELQLTLSPKSPFFRARTMGTIQSATEFQVDRNSESIISFNCKQRTCFSYKMAQLRMLLRSLSLASKVALSTDPNGLLTCHAILLTNAAEGDESQMYIEYFILPLSASAMATGGASLETESEESNL